MTIRNVSEIMRKSLLLMRQYRAKHHMLYRRPKILMLNGVCILMLNGECFVVAGKGLLNSNKGNLRCLLSLNFIAKVCQTNLKESLPWLWNNSKKYKYLPLNKHDYPLLYRMLNADAMIKMIVSIWDTRVGGKHIQI